MAALAPDMPVPPRVSVVLPTYNRAGVLGRAVRSVLAQSEPDLELIVVDDASTDETPRVLADFDDPRLHVLHHTVRRGGAAARNTGLAAARAEWVAFQDSDDEWLLDKLARQLTVAAQDPALGAVYCAFVRISGDTATRTPAAKHKRRSGWLHADILRDSFISTQTLLVRRTALDAAGGFDTELPRFQDWELMMRLSRHHPIGCVDEPLAIVHTLPDAITHDAAARLRARMRIVERHALWLAAHPRTLAEHLYAIGHLHALAGEIAAARHWLRRAVATDRRFLKAWAALALTGLGTAGYARATRLRGQWRDA